MDDSCPVWLRKDLTTKLHFFDFLTSCQGIIYNMSIQNGFAYTTCVRQLTTNDMKNSKAGKKYRISLVSRVVPRTHAATSFSSLIIAWRVTPLSPQGIRGSSFCGLACRRPSAGGHAWWGWSPPEGSRSRSGESCPRSPSARVPPATCPPSRAPPRVSVADAAPAGARHRKGPITRWIMRRLIYFFSLTFLGLRKKSASNVLHEST